MRSRTAGLRHCGTARGYAWAASPLTCDPLPRPRRGPTPSAEGPSSTACGCYTDLYAWQRTASGGWRDPVSHIVGIGEEYLMHIDEDQVRPLSPDRYRDA